MLKAKDVYRFGMPHPREASGMLSIASSPPSPVFSQQEKALASFSPQWSLDR